MQFSRNPVTDTSIKLFLFTCVMGASVFFVMIPLYNVLCDALGINGKTSGVAYTAMTTEVDTGREIQVQFITQNNNDMPWEFDPSTTIVRVNPAAPNTPNTCLLYTSPSPRDRTRSRMPSSA